MSLMSKEQLKQWIKEKNMQSVEDVQSALKELFADTLQEMLEAELETSLGYAKHDTKNKKTTNSRNGYSKKKVRSEYGDVDIQVPRDRAGEFEPTIVKKNQTNVTGIEDQIIAMYAKGVSTRDIQDHLQQLYGIEVSPPLISNVTNKIVPLIKVPCRRYMRSCSWMPFTSR
jgi:putative transposase